MTEASQADVLDSAAMIAPRQCGEENVGRCCVEFNAVMMASATIKIKKCA
jgi:hypothetical protein